MTEYLHALESTTGLTKSTAEAQRRGENTKSKSEGAEEAEVTLGRSLAVAGRYSGGIRGRGRRIEFTAEAQRSGENTKSKSEGAEGAEVTYGRSLAVAGRYSVGIRGRDRRREYKSQNVRAR